MSNDWGELAGARARPPISKDELELAGSMLPYTARHHPDWFASQEAAEAEGVFVVVEEEQVAGAGWLMEVPFSIGGVRVRAVRPGETGNEAAGVPDAAFLAGLLGGMRIAATRGINLAVVHGSQYDHAFGGYVPCFHYPLATLPVEAALVLEPTATVEKARGAEVEEADAACLADPFTPKMGAFVGLGSGERHVIRENGAVTGYVRVDREFDPADKAGMPLGYVTDLTVRTAAAARAVLRLAGELAAARGGSEVVLMHSHESLVTREMLALGGTYRLRGSCDLPGLDAEMAAVVDYPGLVAELEEVFRARVTGSIASRPDCALSISTCGRAVTFRVVEGNLTINGGEADVSIELPRWAATRLLLGYYGGEDLLAMGPIPGDVGTDDGGQALELPPPQAELFRTLFPRLWPTSLPDPDVWPWVLGKPHPRYQNEPGKDADMKRRIDALKFPWHGR